MVSSITFFVTVTIMAVTILVIMLGFWHLSYKYNRLKRVINEHANACVDEKPSYSIGYHCGKMVVFRSSEQPESFIHTIIKVYDDEDQEFNRVNAEYLIEKLNE